MSSDPLHVGEAVASLRASGGPLEAPGGAALPDAARRVRVPVGDAVDQLGPTVAEVWIAFATLTFTEVSVRSGQVAAVAGLSRGHTLRLLHALRALGLARLQGKRWHRVWMLRDLSGYRDAGTGNWVKGKFRRYTWRSVGDIAGGARYERRGAQVLAAIQLALRGGRREPVSRALLARWCGCGTSTITRALRHLEKQQRIKRTATPVGVVLVLLDAA